LRNRNILGISRTAVNKARAAFEISAPDTQEAVVKAISALDKAAEQGVIHKNKAARGKSRLMKRLSSFKPAETPAEAPAKAPKTKKKTSKKSE